MVHACNHSKSKLMHINLDIVAFHFLQAVRRMKTSPLTAEEIARIHEVVY